MADDVAHGSTLGMADGDLANTQLLAAGSRLGRFRVRSQLGQGGMGVVFAGDDLELGRPVAIKIVRSDVDQPAYRDRLMREAQAMARLEHPHVVRVYEVGTDKGRLFIAMELVDGLTLTRWLETPRPWREIIAMFRQAGLGLAAAHATGLVHRDFKPDNVLIDRNGHARVADFGLARLEDNSAPQLTKTGVMMGTPGYMAPEQQWGSDVDARADQYSFCVALREATKTCRDLPREVKETIARGLAYDASERFASMHELMDGLGETPSRRRWWMIGGAVLVGATIAAVVVAVQHAPEAKVETRVETKTQIIQAPPIIVMRDREPPPASPKPPPPAPAAPAIVHATGSAAAAPGLGSYVAPKPVAVAASTTTRSAITRHALGHPVPARVAVHDLGYGGLTFAGDSTNDEQELRDQLAKLGPDDDLLRGNTLYALGAVQRRAGHCDSATATWQSAFEPLHRFNQAHRTDERVWHPWVRILFGQALCLVEQNRGIEAFALLDHAVRQNSFGFTPPERAAFHFVAGLVAWDTGDPEGWHEIRLGPGSDATPALEQAVTNWATTVGLGK